MSKTTIILFTLEDPANHHAKGPYRITFNSNGFKPEGWGSSVHLVVERNRPDIYGKPAWHVQDMTFPTLALPMIFQCLLEKRVAGLHVVDGIPVVDLGMLEIPRPDVP